MSFTKLRNTYGVYSGVLNCNAFDQLDKQTKKELSTAYCIIFVLSDDIISFCNKTFSVSVSKDDENYLFYKAINERYSLVFPSEEKSFIDMYKYVNEINSHAIACVIGKGKSLDNNLEFPKYMGDFERLHRLELTFSNENEDVKELFDNIRYYYSDGQKEKFNNLTAVTMGEIQYYYRVATKYSKYGLVISIVLIACMFLGYIVCTSGEEGMTIWYLAALIPVIVTLILKNMIKLEEIRRYKSNVVFIKDSIIENSATIFERRVRGLWVIVKCLVYILVGLGAFYCEEEEFINCIFIALGTLIYLFYNVNYFYSIIQEHRNLFLKSNTEYVNYLDFAISLRAQQKTFLKKQCIFFAAATIISCVAFVLMSLFI